MYLPEEIISSKNYCIWNQGVVLDKDLASLYAVENNQLKRQVRKNIDRFPEDFMFEITEVEYEILRN